MRVLADSEIPTNYGYISVKFSLIPITYDIYRVAEGLLNKETFPAMVKADVVNKLRRKKIQHNDLFDIQEAEIPLAIESVTKDVLKMFAINLENFVRHALFDAVAHSKIGYIQKVLRPLYKEHWHELGLGKSFNLITKDQLDEVRKEQLDWRRWFLGDRHTELLSANLPIEAEELRKTYTEVKKKMKASDANFQISNKDSSTRLDVERVRYLSQQFPQLHPAVIDQLVGNPPSVLARKELGIRYGCSEDTIRRMIEKVRKGK